MDKTTKKIFITFMTSSLLLASSISSAKQAEIGIGAIAVDSSVVGKGKFVVNDTIDEGDALKTGGEGSTTILFNDESMLTLGPGAHASVEVYKEAKNGQPGRSVIRVHNGQFRYFPGDILENGGSQFIAVGNKLLGKAGIEPNAPQSNASLQGNSASSNSQNPSTKNSNGNNAGNGNAGNNQGSSESNTQPETSEEVIIPGVDGDTEQGQGSNKPDQDTDKGSDGKHKPGLQLSGFHTSSVGTDGTGGQGGASGTKSFEHEDDPFNKVGQNNQPSLLAGDNTPAPTTTPDVEDNTLDNGLLTNAFAIVNEGSSSAAVSGLTTSTGGLGSEDFAENGISGNVADGIGSFHGAADIFGSTNVNARTGFSFIGAIKVDKDIALNLNARTGFVDLNKGGRLSQTGLRKGFPTGELAGAFDKGITPTKGLVPDFQVPKLPTDSLPRLPTTDIVKIEALKIYVEQPKIEEPEPTPTYTPPSLTTSTAIFTAQ